MEFFAKSQPTWVASRDMNAYTAQIEASSVDPARIHTTTDGRKQVRSGTLVKYNTKGGETDVQTQGLLVETVDITDAPALGSVMLTGFYYADKLPYALTAQEKADLLALGVKPLLAD